MQRVNSVDSYFANLLVEIERVHSSVREAIREAVPTAEESMHVPNRTGRAR